MPPKPRTSCPKPDQELIGGRCLVRCRADQVRDTETRRCRASRAGGTAKRQRNRAYRASNKGKAAYARRKAAAGSARRRRSPAAANANNRLTPCGPGQRRNPHTRRCSKEYARYANVHNLNTRSEPCTPMPYGKSMGHPRVRNPKTGRCSVQRARQAYRACPPGKVRDAVSLRCRNPLRATLGSDTWGMATVAYDRPHVKTDMAVGHYPYLTGASRRTVGPYTTTTSLLQRAAATPLPSTTDLVNALAPAPRTRYGLRPRK